MITHVGINTGKHCWDPLNNTLCLPLRGALIFVQNINNTKDVTFDKNLILLNMKFENITKGD